MNYRGGWTYCHGNKVENSMRRQVFALLLLFAIAIGYWIGTQEKHGLETEMLRLSEYMKSVQIGLFFVRI